VKLKKVTVETRIEANMPAVVSKFLSDAMDRYERKGNNVEIISKTIVSTALVAYVIKLSYPHIQKRFGRNRSKSNEKLLNNNNSKVSKYIRKGKEKIPLQSIKDEKLKIIEKKLKQPGLNLEFVLQLKRLVEIMIPKLVCRETGLLSVHTLCLISRTFLSIYVAAMEGAIVKYIVRKDVKNFAWMLIKWFGIAIPATFINSMIRYLENKLALAFR
jgi:ATP-binding cassette, subfamily D (ALD), member 2